MVFKNGQEAWNKDKSLDGHRDKIVNLYEKGLSTYDIAKKYNKSPITVYRILKEENAKIRNFRESLKLRDKKVQKQFWESEEVKKENQIIKEEYEKGTPMKDIASMIGLSEKPIHDRLKRISVKLNRTHPRGEAKRIFCACGCGKQLWSLDKQRRYVKYIRGHSGYDKIWKLNKKEIIELYKKGQSVIQIGKAFNVSADVIVKLLRNNKIDIFNRTTYGRLSVADDGHKVRSGMELEVDNWLFSHRIAHVYEKRLGETLRKCDFFLPDLNTYIEVFGLTNKTYKEKTKEKLQLYRELGLINNLLMIFPKDNIQEKLRTYLIDKQPITIFEVNHGKKG